MGQGGGIDWLDQRPVLKNINGVNYQKMPETFELNKRFEEPPKVIMMSKANSATAQQNARILFDSELIIYNATAVGSQERQFHAAVLVRLIIENTMLLRNEMINKARGEQDHKLFAKIVQADENAPKNFVGNLVSRMLRC
jgi:hypothetical protein